MLEERIASQYEVIRAIVSDYSPCCGVPHLGKACGLMMMSGVIPESVNGMSRSGHSCDRVPFCPCRLENLSPITGLRLNRILRHTLRRGCLPRKLGGLPAIAIRLVF